MLSEPALGAAEKVLEVHSWTTTGMGSWVDGLLTWPRLLSLHRRCADTKQPVYEPYELADCCGRPRTAGSTPPSRPHAPSLAEGEFPEPQGTSFGFASGVAVAGGCAEAVRHIKGTATTIAEESEGSVADDDP